MERVFLMLALLCTSLLLSIGVINPESPVMWLASTSVGFAVVRAAMIAGLAALLLTHPPRNKYLREGIGIAAAGLAGWVLVGMYEPGVSMKLLDQLSLLQFSISAGLAALEREIPVPVQSTKSKTSKAKHSTTKQRKTRATA